MQFIANLLTQRILKVDWHAESLTGRVTTKARLMKALTLSKENEDLVIVSNMLQAKAIEAYLAFVGRNEVVSDRDSCRQ